MIDFHCHLDLYPNPYEVIQHCDREGVYVLSVTTTPKAWHGSSKLVKGCEKIRTALGFHPQLAHERHNEIDLFDELLPQTRYVGEIGLEGAKDWKPFMAVQKKVFAHILKSSTISGGRIMSIHSRYAVDEVFNLLIKYPDAGIPVLHWFTGTKTQLRKAISIGCWFSVGISMLSTKKGRAIVNEIPKDRILTETDGPFVKYRSKQLMPWNVKYAVTELANSWKCQLFEAENQIVSNFRKLFVDI